MSNHKFGLYKSKAQYIILGFDTELQVVNGKQYTDIKADDFSKLIEYLQCMSPLQWIDLCLLACGENVLWKGKIEAPKTESTGAGEVGLCSYTVISDRFALTAEHCNIG